SEFRHKVCDFFHIIRRITCYNEIKKNNPHQIKEMMNMLKWLKENKVVTVLLTVVRIYLGWTWFIAGWHKIVAATPFDATGYLTNAVNNPVIDRATNEAVYPIFTAFLKHFALPNVNIVNVLVPWGELFIGIGLI